MNAYNLDRKSLSNVFFLSLNTPYSKLYNLLIKSDKYWLKKTNYYYYKNILINALRPLRKDRVDQISSFNLIFKHLEQIYLTTVYFFIDFFW